MRLAVANRKAIEYACLHFHYAKRVPQNTFGINVYNDKDEWCGVVLYGLGASMHIGKPYGLFMGECVELVRVALNGKQEHTSQVVSASLKFLKKHCPCVRLVVSFADCDQNHLGTIYQATNWIYVGTHMKDEKDGSWMVHGRRVHSRTISHWVKNRGGLRGLSREQFIHKFYDKDAVECTTKGKRKYLMPLDKRLKKMLKPLARAYPKGKGWIKIDRSKFKSDKEVPQQDGHQCTGEKSDFKEEHRLSAAADCRKDGPTI
ncbi:MAG: protein Mom [Kiritimatiellae bacterium]|nr:protein Mom [Kiritimatiellia bacterium]